MLNPRIAKLSDFEKIIGLINKVFRLSRGHKPTMEMEFPLLLNRDNIDNMIVIEDQGKIISVANFLVQEVIIEGISLKTASLGAVCTDPLYEGKGYSSRIIDFVEGILYKKEIDLLLISGERTLYTRRMATQVKNFYKYTIEAKKVGLKLSIEDYEDKYLYDVLERYNQNSTRFYRTKDQFESLLESATIPWGNFSYKKHIVKNEGEFIGYIVLRIIDGDGRRGQIIEMDIPNKYAHDLLSHLASEHSLDYIEYYLHIKDYKNHLEDYDKRELDYLYGTIKIINFEKMMGKLYKYFAQYIGRKDLEELEFIEEEKGYKIIDKKTQYRVNNLDELNKLVFEGSIETNTIIDEVFPINFIWTANLNFQ